MAMPDWKIVTQTRDRLGETPMWHEGEQAIYWIDWYGPTVHRMKPGGTVESWKIPDTSIVGSFVFASGGRLMLAVDKGLVLFDPGNGSCEAFTDPNQGRAAIVFNDSKVDRSGRLWVGTCDLAETEPRGIFYCVNGDGSYSVADSGFAVCNGPAFSPDGRVLYFSDSMGKRVLAYDIVPGHPKLLNRRIFATMGPDDGVPDGLTVDAEGCLWCAHYGAGRLTRFAPDGTVKEVLEVPCPVVTAMCFGGHDMTTLYVTTGWSPGVQRAEDETGPGGALFALETGIKGLAEPQFSPRVAA
ncbi:SMP-30/gluconolactonase/LRE family protein [Aestuariivirga sp.]|uniref:SMP-30/gluconolactonase/LRE family protein n=1 Tax=Aestuariivirga sp. TaxID=2650926 RepID=UPI003593492F